MGENLPIEGYQSRPRFGKWMRNLFTIKLGLTGFPQKRVEEGSFKEGSFSQGEQEDKEEYRTEEYVEIDF